MTIENLQKLLEIEEQIKSLKNEAEAIKDEIKKRNGKRRTFRNWCLQYQLDNYNQHNIGQYKT